MFLMKKNILIMVTMFLVMLILSGCGGPQYEGKWLGSTKSDWDGTTEVQKLDIKKNGENYIVTFATERFVPVGKIMDFKVTWKEQQSQPVSATLKDGKLVIDPYRSYTLVKDTGTILGPKGETYKVENENDHQKLKEEAKSVYLNKHPKTTFE